jgi:hypothetical protein
MGHDRRHIRRMQGKTEYEIGKGKPPKHTQFQAGQSGNPGGKTSTQRAMEIANAERATRIRGRFLEALEGLMLEHPEKETLIEERLTSEVLRLIKESEDRGLGTAKQSVDLSSEDGSMTPKGLPDDLITALDAIAGKITSSDSAG